MTKDEALGAALSALKNLKEGTLSEEAYNDAITTIESVMAQPALPKGWEIERHLSESNVVEFVVRKDMVGLCSAHIHEENTQSCLLYELAQDIYEATPITPSVTIAIGKSETKSAFYRIDEEYACTSRLHAKDIMNQFWRAESVELDFSDVEAIGPNFADELLRVWPCSHPDTHLKITHANEQIMHTVRRVIARRDVLQPSIPIEIESAAIVGCEKGDCTPPAPNAT